MHIPERMTGLAVLVVAFAANALHNHTGVGTALRQIPGFYPIVFFIGIGAVLPAIALGRTVRHAPAVARPLGVALGRRDLIAAIAALLVGGVLAAAPLKPILDQPGGTTRVLTLFAQLLVASTAEVSLFLGAMGVALRALLGGRTDWRYGPAMIVVSSVVFGLFHFTYPAPWNTLGTAVTVGAVWIVVSTFFVLSRSLVAAVLLDNVMATVGFATRDLTLPLSLPTSSLLAAFAIAAFVAAFARAARRPAIAASPSPAPR